MAWEQLAGWDKVSDDTNKELKFKLEVTSIRASWWAAGRNEEEIEKEARRRLKEQGIDYPEKKRS